MNKTDRTFEIMELLNVLRAIAVVNKDDWETAAKKLNLDSAVQLNILWIVLCFDGVRVTQIAEWAFWHPSSIVIHVRKLMEKELVTIEKSDKDGRVVNVYLTEKGREVVILSQKEASEVFRVATAIHNLVEKYGKNVAALFMECLRFLASEIHGKEKIEWLNESEETIRNLNK